MREVRAYLALRRRPDAQFVMWAENDEPTDAAAKTRSSWEDVHGIPPVRDFFQPSFKLAETVRAGARVRSTLRRALDA
jgi:hypothetical protein